jgi:hypothetical protein
MVIGEIARLLQRICCGSRSGGMNPDLHNLRPRPWPGLECKGTRQALGTAPSK